MKTRLEIVRFRSADVIAASGVRRLCQIDGRHYYIEQIVPVEGRDDMYQMIGVAYDYTAEGGLVKLGALSDYGDGYVIPSDAYTLAPNQFYYAPFGHTGYLILCDLQDHGQ